ncbi:MAG: cytochrome c biogenesis protein CcsA, partial [Bacteroidota bacterium]
MDIQYLNEHLLPGKLGHLLLILSFVTSLLASFAYLRSKRALSDELSTSWKHVGRAAFSVHGISLIGVVGIIFYVMLNQYYEYNYVWAHVSEDLDFRYIFSAFWEGQEGSFMLWMFWHIVLGWILMFNAGKWEAPVMSILSFVQFFIGSMLVGLYFYVGDEFIKIGSNPLLLLRDVQEAPIFLRPDYTDLINGNGLSPLLQNYWMTIHPPTLFLGFASTVVPFCFAVAGLWTSDHKGWMAPALRWALFSGAILGTGILMGGAWAYEALSFGGYWAWDPVENMSLVPWLVLVSGIHMNVVAKNTGYYIKQIGTFDIIA